MRERKLLKSYLEKIMSVIALHKTIFVDEIAQQSAFDNYFFQGQ